MSEAIITVENLSKRYKLGVIGATSLRESVERGWHRLRGRDWRAEMGTLDTRPWTRDSKGNGKTLDQGSEAASQESPKSKVYSPMSSPNDLWALKDVSFEVKRGEVLGIIGRNGAGKSTLLKILTRVTEPTSGRAIMRGRVASLLEVGTGFHPELTGRENVYLNGAILGMRRAEINAKFDEIVAFAEVEKFIDTPVKRYSSGMYVRLAFAVAAHLEPEILLVDEVLAVGDAAFQKRCLGKMKDVATQGRTVLFVSHNMAAIKNLCDRVLWLTAGQIASLDKTEISVGEYLQSVHNEAKKTDLRRTVNRTGNGPVRLIGFHLETANNKIVQSLYTGQPCCIVLEYENVNRSRVTALDAALGLRDENGIRCVRMSMVDQSMQFESAPEKGNIRCYFPRFPLQRGTYVMGVIINVMGVMSDLVLDAGAIVVNGGDYYGKGKLTVDGPVFVEHEWEVL